MIMKKYSLNPVLSSFFFLSLMILFSEMGVAQNTTSTIPVNVGVVLDLASLEANIALSCINMALSDFYASHGDYKTRLVLNTRDSKKDVIGAAAAGSLSAPSLDYHLFSPIMNHCSPFLTANY
jgi:ionotropic glutamate receptor